MVSDTDSETRGVTLSDTSALAAEVCVLAVETLPYDEYPTHPSVDFEIPTDPEEIEDHEVDVATEDGDEVLYVSVTVTGTEVHSRTPHGVTERGGPVPVEITLRRPIDGDLGHVTDAEVNRL